MGAALDSFVITMGYAGIVAIVLLAYCLFSRHRNNSGNLNVFQRMPVLLPALGFVITVMLVASAGLTPMALYQGVNSRQFSTMSGEDTSFTMRDQLFYSTSLQIQGNFYLEYNDSIHFEITVSQDDIVIDTMNLDFLFSSMHSTVTIQESITVDPGTYDLQVNFTRYEAGILDEEEIWLQLTVSQPLIAGFIEEIVDWSSFQFAINISCILFLLGGIGIGSSAKRGPRKMKDETDWKTTTEYEY